MDIIIQFWEDQKGTPKCKEKLTYCLELYENALALAEARKKESNLDELEIKENFLDEASHEDDPQTEAEKTFRKNLNQIYAPKFNKVYKEFRLILAKLGFFKVCYIQFLLGSCWLVVGC